MITAGRLWWGGYRREADLGRQRRALIMRRRGWAGWGFARGAQDHVVKGWGGEGGARVHKSNRIRALIVARKGSVKPKLMEASGLKRRPFSAAEPQRKAVEEREMR